MKNMVTDTHPTRENWLQELGNVITDPFALLSFLKLDKNIKLRQGAHARALFPLRVPIAFAEKMTPGDPKDPLLLQVLTLSDEFVHTSGFSADPLYEQAAVLPGLLHKYRNRVLMLIKGGCAVHCRYCFRRHFPYQDNKGSQVNREQVFNYIRKHTELDEVIFSGGDPLMAKDPELASLVTVLESIPHIKRLRIHTRLPIVIPSRITTRLCESFSNSSLQILMVTHINHPNEMDQTVYNSMYRLKQAGVTLLNQTVLLKDVNNNAEILAQLSNRLFNAGILPYYLHLLDKVQGAAHFMVEEHEARQIMKALLGQVSGYLVPRLTREVAGQPSKIPIDLQLLSYSAP